tara:strand:+ start:120 stop:779 length:660 start_codon:yes stop_codon:yes gene_type:complete
MYWDEKDQTHNLEFDGLHQGTASLSNNVLYPSDLVLTDIGAIQLKYALCNLPINKTFGKFWGYKDQPIDEGLWNCELPEENDVLVQLSSKDKDALIAVANHLSNASCWKNNVAWKGGDIITIPTPDKWGDWYFDKSNLTLTFLPMSYEIDLARINSCASMLDWIFQLNGKKYSQDCVKDLINAFGRIFEPQANCCSFEINKKFSGSELAKKYAKVLKND